MKKPLAIRFATLALISSFFTPVAFADQDAEAVEKIKVVFIAGKPSHGPGAHEHRAGCMLLASHLEKSGSGFETTVVTNGWPEDDAVLKVADAIVIYADGGSGHPAMPHLELLRELSEKGTGIGCIHYGVEVPKGEAGDTFLDAIGGYFEKNWSVNPHWTASFSLPDHPIANGINDYKINDEWYYHMRFRENLEGVVPILSAMPPQKSLARPDGSHSGNPHVRKAVLEDKEPQHVMWAFNRPENGGGGRGFGFTGGHFHRNWKNDDQRRIVLNAIAWISGSTVPEDGIRSVTPSDAEMKANLDQK